MNREFLGFDLIVYVILLIIALPLFFFWRWVYRKSDSTVRRRILIWLTTILTAPLLYVIIVIVYIFISDYYPNRDFDKHAWQTNKNKRYEYTKDLIKSKVLIGKTKSDVIKFLGKEADTSQANELSYAIGYKPEIFDIDPSYLVVDFKNEKVDTVREEYR